MTIKTFEKRRVGTTGLEVTALGVGSANIAGLFKQVPDADARATIANAYDAGVRYFDTAPQYGYGRAEHLVGDALRFRPDLAISTKVGRLLRPVQSESERVFSHSWADPFPFEPVYNYTYEGIMRSFEDSLQRLGLPKVEILFVHDIGKMTHGERNTELWNQLASGGYRALRQLRDSGVVSAIGLGVNEWEVVMDAFELGEWDLFLLAGRYTLLDQSSLDPVLTTCTSRGASVVCGGPFNGGALMGAANFNYDALIARAAFAQGEDAEGLLRRIKGLEAFCRDRNVPLPAAALQFPLAHPAVATVLPGPQTPDELTGILDWWSEEIPDDFWADLATSGLLRPGSPVPGGRIAG